jgi:Xaa-Pro aminopeptidase
MKNSKTGAELIVAASERDANLLYATRFFAPDAFIFFRHRGKKFVVMNDLEIDRARQQAMVDSVMALSFLEKELKEKGRRVINTAAALQLLFSKRNVRAVSVPSDFPLALADQLRRRGLRVRARAGTFFHKREIKTEEEVRAITKVQRAAEASMEAAIALIREAQISRSGVLTHGGVKLTAEAVKERIATTALRLGCIAGHTIVACGGQGCDPHNEGRGALRAGQPIILDIFPRCQTSGYWGDITRTVVKGRASERLRSLFQAVLTGQAIALHMIKPGVTGREVHQAVLDSFQARSFETGLQNGRMQGFFHGTGHGIGLELHEEPRIASRGTQPLKSGHVVTVEPGLYYSGIGGVRIEDLVLITPRGISNLTRFPKYLEV